MNKQRPTIVLTGGGTGGHLVPLRFLAQEIKKQSPASHLVYIGHKGDQFSEVLDKTLFDNFYEIDAGKLRRYPLTPKTLILNARDVFKLIHGIFQARKILKHISPDVLFSKGSFVAVPVLLPAKKLKIPVVTHDSDSVPGLANRICSKWAAAHATGMPLELYNYDRNKSVYVGVPIDPKYYGHTSPSYVRATKQANRIAGSKTLLIMGGSLGASYINQIGPLVSKSLLDKYPDLSIVHITGHSHFNNTLTIYKQLIAAQQLLRVKVIPFTDKLIDFIDVADVVITRAGATTLAELSAKAKPIVIVPSPYVSGGHQLRNAEWMQQKNAAVVVQNGAPAEELVTALGELLLDEEKRNTLSHNISTIATPKAASNLASLILKTASRKG